MAFSIFKLQKARRAHLRLGRRGEKAAVRLLRNLGMEVIATNFSGPNGEIDVIARDGAILCFVEVKTRRNASRTRPADAVTASKRKRLLRTADRYLRLLGRPKITRRLDVIEVVYDGNRLADLRYWPDEIRPRET